MNNMSLNNIHEWPLMTRLLLLLLVFLGVFYLGYRFNLSSQIQSLSRAQQQEVDLKQQIEFVVHKTQTIQSEVSQLPELQDELVKWKNQLVNYNDLPELLNQILKLGADNNLFFSSFTPGDTVKVEVPSKLAANAEAATPTQTGATESDITDTAKTKASFDKVSIKVVVVGKYHQLADFISQLANLPWIVAIGDFTISNENQSTLLGESLAKQAEAQHLLTAEMMLDVYNTPESK